MKAWYYPGVQAFALEREMVKVLSAQLGDALPEAAAAHGFRILDHPPVGARIPDLVVLYTRRRSCPVAPATLTYFEADVLARLLPAAATTATLGALVHTAPVTVLGALRRLHRVGLVVEVGVETFAINRGAFPQDVEIVAVEAKLARWREALTQARGYLRFANRSFIAMPGAVVRTNLQLLTECARDGIGVLAVEPTSTSVVLDAERQQPRSGDRLRLIANTFGIRQRACK